MIILKIILIIFCWLFIGVATQFLMYARRKITGLKTDGEFKVISGTYVAFHNREKPSDNCITGFAVMLLGPLAFVVWTVGTFMFLLCPLFAYCLATFFNRLIYVIFGVKDKDLILKNFINKDVPHDDDDYGY